MKTPAAKAGVDRDSERGDPLRSLVTSAVPGPETIGCRVSC